MWLFGVSLHWLPRDLLIFSSRAGIRLPQGVQSVVGEKTGHTQGLTVLQIPNIIPWHSHHGPHPGSSSLNIQFIHYNKATYLNRSRTSSPTWSPLLAPTHPKLDALGQQSSGCPRCTWCWLLSSQLPCFLSTSREANRPPVTKASPSLKTPVREHDLCSDVTHQEGRSQDTEMKEGWKEHPELYGAPRSASQAPRASTTSL